MTLFFISAKMKPVIVARLSQWYNNDLPIPA